MKYFLSAAFFLTVMPFCQASDHFMMDDGLLFPHVVMEDIDADQGDVEPAAFSFWDNISSALEMIASSTWPVMGFDDDEIKATAEDKVFANKKAYLAGVQEGRRQKDEIEELLQGTDIIVQHPIRTIDKKVSVQEEVDYTPYDKSFLATRKRLEDPSWAGHWDVSGHNFTLAEVAQLLGVMQTMPSKERTIDLSPAENYAHSVVLSALVLKFQNVDASVKIILNGLRLPENFHDLPGVSSVHFKNTTTYENLDDLQIMCEIISAKEVIIE